MDKVRKIYVVTLSFDNLPEDGVLRAARSLSGCPIIFNGQELPHPNNEVCYAEHIHSTDMKAIVLVEDEELNMFCERDKPLYVTAKIYDKYYPLFTFTALVVSTKPIASGSKSNFRKVSNIKIAFDEVCMQLER